MILQESNKIIKIPKKLRDLFNKIRNGKIEEGVSELNKFDNYRPQILIALAEIHYFKSEFEEALTLDEEALPYDDQWYAGNVLFEHFNAYTKTASKNNLNSRAENFYLSFLRFKEKLNLPDHRFQSYLFQVNQQLHKLKNKAVLKNDSEKLTLELSPFDKDFYIKLLNKNRPGVLYESTQGAEYLLQIMLGNSNTLESLNYYEKYAENLKIASIHLDAARLFILLNKTDKAIKAILTFSEKAWFPVEFFQVAPMILFQYDEFDEILNSDFKEKILRLTKYQS